MDLLDRPRMVWTMPFRAQWGARLLLQSLDVAWAETHLLRWAVQERLPNVDEPHSRGLFYTHRATRGATRGAIH